MVTDILLRRKDLAMAVKIARFEELLGDTITEVTL